MKSGCVSRKHFHLTKLDGKTTIAMSLDKTNLANFIATPSCSGY